MPKQVPEFVAVRCNDCDVPLGFSTDHVFILCEDCFYGDEEGEEEDGEEFDEEEVEQ